MIRVGKGAAAIHAKEVTAAAGAEPFEAAWRSLRADQSIQFALPASEPHAKPPAWIESLGQFMEWLLRPVGRLFAWLMRLLPDAAYARFLLGTLLVAGAATLMILIVQRMRHGQWRWPWRRKVARAPADPNDTEWRPDAAPVHAWLEEADALAKEGRFAEAVHCLLLRSVDDAAKRRPQLVSPALTARELASMTILPDRARALFAGIARSVERSLFGGQPVDSAEWTQARAAYAQFALAGAWKR